MDQRRFGGLLLVVLVVASTLDDVVDGQRTINKCCAKNERLHWAEDTGQYECETVPQGTVPGERYNVDGVVEDGMKTNVTEDAGESVTVAFGGDFDEVQFGKFMENLNSKVAISEDEVVAGFIPSCHIDNTDWLFSFGLRTTPNAVTLRAAPSNEFPAKVWCVDLDDEEELAAIVCPCAAENPPCVRKCCLREHALDENQQCVKSNLNWTLPQGNSNKTNYLLKGKIPTCKYLSTETFPPDRLTLQADGSMKGIDAVGRNVEFGLGQFCVDATNATNSSDPIGDQMVIFCIITDDVSDAVTVFKGVVTLLGAVALLVTVVLTIFLPEMRQNIHGKMALCHNVSLLFAFICIGISQVVQFGPIMCKVVSFVMQYTLLAAFFWLNVMCVEVSWVFSALRPVKKVMAGYVDMKFRWYSLYAWGTTSLITIITILVEFVPGAKLKPRFGEANCFFHGDSMIPQLLFLFGPMGILLAINVGLFIYTATKIITHRRQTSILNDSNTNNRNNQNLILYIKLFTLMGVTWIFEIVSWAVGGKNYYWLAIDCVNLLRGIFIFFIFCCKRSVIDSLRARFGCSPAKDGSQSSAGTKSTLASNEAQEMTDNSIATRRNSELR